MEQVSLAEAMLRTDYDVLWSDPIGFLSRDRAMAYLAHQNCTNKAQFKELVRVGARAHDRQWFVGTRAEALKVRRVNTCCDGCDNAI